MREGGIKDTVITVILILLVLITFIGMLYISIISKIPIIITIIEPLLFIFALRKVIKYFMFSGYLYVNFSNALKENEEKAKEYYKELTRTLPKNVSKITKKLITFLLLTILSIVFLCLLFYLTLNTSLHIIEILFIASIGVFLWLSLYTWILYLNYKKIAKICFAEKELELINDTYSYKDFISPMSMEGKQLGDKLIDEEALEAQITASSQYKEAKFDEFDTVSTDIESSVWNDIELTTSQGKLIHIKHINSARPIGSNGGNKLLFNGLFVHFTEFMTEYDYSCIRFTNSNSLVSKFYQGNKIRFDNDILNEKFVVYSDNDLTVQKLFEGQFINNLIELDEKYRIKYEVLIQSHEIFIRIFENRLFKVHMSGKQISVKDISRDITTLQFAKSLAQILYDATNK